MKKKLLFIGICLVVILMAVTFTACDLFGKGDDPSSSSGAEIGLWSCTAKADNDNFEYDGTEKVVNISIYNGDKLITTISGKNSHPDLEVEYSDNVNAGEASVLIKPKENNKKYKGSITCNFTIKQASVVNVDTVSKLLEITQSRNYAEIVLTQDIETGKNEYFSVLRGVTLNLNGHFLCAGTAVSNFGTIKMPGNSIMVLHGTFNNNGSVVSSGDNCAIYSDNNLAANGIDSNIVVYNRLPIGASLASHEEEYTGSEICPEVLTGISSEEYTVEYSQNVNIGQGCVTVKANPLSKVVFGEAVLYFMITSKTFTVTNEEELIAVLADPNNKNVILDGSFADVTVPEDCNFSVDGTTTIGNLTIDGTLIINSGKNLTVSGDLRVSGTLSANGSLSVQGMLYNEGDVYNGTKFVVDGATENKGNLTNAGNGKLTFKSDFVNKDDAIVANNGIMFFEQRINNTGKLTNMASSIIYFCADGNISNEVANSGSIYTDYAIDFVRNDYRGTLVKREPIADDKIWLSATDLYYINPRTDNKPLLMFANGLNVDGSDYVTTRRYDTDDADSWNTIKPGKVNYTITFKPESKSYTGSIVLVYNIFKGTYTIKGNSDFDTAFGDENYATALLDTELSTNKELNIPSFIEFKIGENGRLIYSSKMTINGELNNYGKIAFQKKDGSQIELADCGTINNYGAIYFNDIGCERLIQNLKNPDTSTVGTIYIRTEMQKEYIQGVPEEVEFDTLGGPKPNVEVVYNGESVPALNNWQRTYGNNTYANSQNAVVKVTATDFSETFYGAAFASFKIVPGTITVKTFDDMEKALSSTYLDNGVYLSNFKTIYLGNDVVSIIGAITSTEYKKVTIPQGAVLDCGEHTISLRVKDGQKGSYEFINKGTIKTQKEIMFNKMSGEGTIEGYTKNMEDLVGLVKMCHVVYFTGAITNVNTITTLRTKFCNTTIDLQGYQLGSPISLYCDRYSIKVTSSQGTSTVNAYGFVNSIKVEYASSNYKVKLENLTVYGLDKGNFGSYVELVNCTIK